MPSFVVPFKLLGKTRLGDPELEVLVAAAPAIVPARDGTTNAIALADPSHFRPLYGRKSARRFERALGARTLDLPGLVDDVDTWDDLRRVVHAPRVEGARVNVTVLSGGVGGAKLVRALAETLGGERVTTIVNVGDDIEALGLPVSPDLDSVLYALAGVADEERGWGRAGETWHALETVSALGGDDWFKLGDRDLGLHLVRTQALRNGEPLSSVTARVARALGVTARLLPATDDELRTFVVTPAGTFSFQEWFVARGHRDDVDAVEVRGVARPAPGVVDAIAAADLLVIGPSNPYVSVGPILAVPALREALERRRIPCVAVSPLVGGRAVKGPADRMLARLAGGTTPAHVASCYAGLIDALVIDESDEPGDLDVQPIVTRTLMTDAQSRRRVADATLSVPV